MAWHGLERRAGFVSARLAGRELHSTVLNLNTFAVLVPAACSQPMHTCAWSSTGRLTASYRVCKGLC